MRMVFRALGLAFFGLSALPPAFAESNLERSSAALLDALAERQMPDAMLWVIDRARVDDSLSADFRATLPFRRAEALIGLSRTEGDAARRAALLDDAARSLDAFLEGHPSGDQAIAAYTQKGNLLIQRGLGAIEQSRRPGQDATQLGNAAIGFFERAVACLKGSVTPDQKQIAAVTTAEDAVIKELRGIDEQIAAIKPPASGKAPAEGKAAEGKAKSAKPPPRLSIAQQKELDRLEELQQKYRGQLLSTRILVGAALYEKSKAFPAGSKESAATLAESTEIFKTIAEKYAATAATAAAYSRFYWGRNLAAAGMHEQAAEVLAPLLAIDGRSPVAVALRAKAVNTSLECWLATAAAAKDPATARRILERLDDGLRGFVLTPAERLPGRRLDAEWLALKFRAATALDELAGRLAPPERNARLVLQRDARKLAIEVAVANRDFSKEARDLAARLGKDLPADAGADRSVAAIVADARVAFTAFQEKQAVVKQLQASGRVAEAEAAATSAAADRDAAIAAVERAVAAGAEADSPADVAAVNSARVMLAYLMYEARRYEEAAAIGGLLMEQHPNAVGSRQAARVALASLQQLAAQAPPGTAQTARATLAACAESMVRLWPAEAEGADAWSVLLNAAIEAHDAAGIVSRIDAFPKDSPRRPEFILRAATALRREAQEARRSAAESKPDDAVIKGWNAAARAALDDGLAALPAAAPPAGQSARVVLSAALARGQMALEDGDRETVTRILEHPVYGPWAAVERGDPAVLQGPLAETTLTVALRHFIETEQLDKAQRAMEALEKAAGTGDESSAKLSAMYLAMGRDLQAQLESLGTGSQADTPEVRDRARRILEGFEKFLEGVSKRDPKTSSQIWVATTYFTLGSGTGTGAVVPKPKAEQYLDQSAAAFGRLLARQDDPQAAAAERADIASFEPSIRLKIAGIHRARGRWDEAQEQMDWLLADSRRQNSLDVQLQAADLLEAAGKAAAAAGDSSRADTLLREAAAGRTAPPIVAWGWSGIATRLSRQAFAGVDDKAAKAREMFFDARLHVADTLLARARLGGSGPDREKRLDAAKTAIAMTRKLYPDLGGDAFQHRFEKLLKAIQREQGAAAPGGFAQLDAESASPASP